MKELAIHLQTESKKALYVQIYEYIVNEIRDGNFSIGEKLPSARFLSDYLKVSRSTVDVAYEQLKAEGYIESRPRSGYFVCDAAQLYAGDTGRDMPAVPETIPLEEELIDFSPYGIDLDAFPMNTLKKINRRVFEEESDSLLSYGPHKGDAKLRHEIMSYLHRARGIRCNEHQIIIGAGNEYLEMLLVQMLGTNRTIAMENPTYMRAYRLFEKMGCRLVTTAMDESGMRVSELYKSSADIAYVMPSHQFPVGCVMPQKRRKELLEWAEAAEGRYIIEDDYDSEYRYKGMPIPSLQGMDMSGKVIYIGTFSKSIAPSMRISYMILPQTLLARYEEMFGFLSPTVSMFQQKTVEYFLKEGHFERHMNRMRRVYKGKRDMLMIRLKEIRGITHISGTDAGLHLLLHVHVRVSEAELVRLCRQKGVKVYPMKDNCISPIYQENEAILLLGYASLTDDEIEKGSTVLIEILKTAAKEEAPFCRKQKNMI